MIFNYLLFNDFDSMLLSSLFQIRLNLKLLINIKVNLNLKIFVLNYECNTIILTLHTTFYSVNLPSFHHQQHQHLEKLTKTRLVEKD